MISEGRMCIFKGGNSVGGIWFIGGWSERVQITLGDDNAGQIVRGGKRKQAEQVRRSKPVSSVLPMVSGSVPGSRFPSRLLSMMDYNLKTGKPFLLKLVRIAEINKQMRAHTGNNLEQGKHLCKCSNLYNHYGNQYVSSPGNYITLIPKGSFILFPRPLLNHVYLYSVDNRHKLEIAL